MKWKVTLLNLLVLFAQVLSFQSIYSGVHKLPRRRLVSASIIVPCHWKHAVLLAEVLDAYIKQTVMPQEMVISLAEVDKVAPEIITQIEQRVWPFRVVLLKHKQPVSEGSNRNYACEAAQGDIFICQDADDIPHWQRVEIIKYFFENYQLDFLIHPFVFDPTQWIWLDPAEIKFSVPIHVNEGGPHANGAVTVSRSLWQQKKWNPRFAQALDAEFNGAVYAKFPHRMLINAPIYYYRNHLSSYNP